MATSVVLIFGVGLLMAMNSAAVKHEESFSGGFSEANVGDDKVNEMAAFATTALSSSQNAGQLTLSKIVKAETQVVAGFNYKMTLNLLTNSDSKPLVCDVVVFNQPWTKTLELIKSSCNKD